MNKLQFLAALRECLTGFPPEEAERTLAFYAEGIDVSLAKEIVRRLTARGETLAVAESLTGGMLASQIVDVPGASQVLVEGHVTYATEGDRARACRFSPVWYDCSRTGSYGRHAAVPVDSRRAAVDPASGRSGSRCIRRIHKHLVPVYSSCFGAVCFWDHGGHTACLRSGTLLHAGLLSVIDGLRPGSDFCGPGAADRTAVRADFERTLPAHAPLRALDEGPTAQRRS